MVGLSWLKIGFNVNDLPEPAGPFKTSVDFVDFFVCNNLDICQEVYHSDVVLYLEVFWPVYVLLDWLVRDGLVECCEEASCL